MHKVHLLVNITIIISIIIMELILALGFAKQANGVKHASPMFDIWDCKFTVSAVLSFVI